MKDLVEYIARELVDDPDAVEVTEVDGERSLIVQLRVAPEDMGKVIGKRGRMARSLRQVVRAAGTVAGTPATLEIVE